MKKLVLLFGAFALIGCGENKKSTDTAEGSQDAGPIPVEEEEVETPSSGEDLTLDLVFPTARVIDVQITVAEADWETIRNQTRNLFEARARNERRPPSPGPIPMLKPVSRSTDTGSPRWGSAKRDSSAPRAPPVRRSRSN